MRATQCSNAPSTRTCQESQTTCSVVDFSTTGQVTGFSTACVAPSNPCPCGKNSLSCPDPNDVPRLQLIVRLRPQLHNLNQSPALENGFAEAKALICTSKFSGKLTTTCPRPCTPEAEQAGDALGGREMDKNGPLSRSHHRNRAQIDRQSVSCCLFFAA